MKEGKVVSSHNASDVIDKSVVSGVFDVNAEIVNNPYSNKPIFVVNGL